MSFNATRASLLVCALAFAAAGAFAQAGKITSKPQPAPPAPVAAGTSTALPGAPSASGLSSPFAPSVAPVEVPGTSAAGTTAAQTAPDSTGGVDTSVMGAGPVYGAGAYGTRGLVRPGAAGPVSDVDIARSFMNADGNRDGELSRAEAMRLSIMPLSFEEMDANHDDRLTRSEYEAAVR